nr:MAG TPA: hypothetical protein [Caudoviricetes sp.]
MHICNSGASKLSRRLCRRAKSRIPVLSSN